MFFRNIKNSISRSSSVNINNSSYNYNGSNYRKVSYVISRITLTTNQTSSLVFKRPPQSIPLLLSLSQSQQSVLALIKNTAFLKDQKRMVGCQRLGYKTIII